MARKLILLAAIMICGCGKRPLYYRQVVDGGEYTYWREYKPTTFHGLCANLYGNKEGTLFEVDHPHTPKPTEVRMFTNRAEAEAWAESVCQTKASK